MRQRYRFYGDKGVELKSEQLKANLLKAIEGLPRTLLVAMTMRDGETCPEAINSPHAVRLFLLDESMTEMEIAVLVGGYREMAIHLVELYAGRYGPQFERSCEIAGKVMREACKLEEMSLPQSITPVDDRDSGVPE